MTLDDSRQVEAGFIWKISSLTALLYLVMALVSNGATSQAYVLFF